jgi:hypothetical protein
MRAAALELTAGRMEQTQEMRAAFLNFLEHTIRAL